MKKSNFVALVLGTVSMIFFALGMCMALLPEWNSFQLGIVLGCVGIVLGVITLSIWRRMEGKARVSINGKTILTVGVGITGAFTLGVGMCFSMVWNQMVMGIGIGLGGIVMLLCLIPMVKGLK